MKKSTIFLMLIILALFISQLSHGQDVYQWRGPARDGKYIESGLLSEWPQEGPQLLWSVETLGPGYAAPVITPNKILVMGVEEGISTLFVFDLDGNLLWKAKNGPSFTGSGFASNFPGSRTTPTVIGDLAYITSGRGRIACFNLNTRKELWAVDMVNDLDGFMNEFSYAESVVADDQNIYCFPGGKKINVAALNRFTGETVWTSSATGDTTHFYLPYLLNCLRGNCTSLPPATTSSAWIAATVNCSGHMTLPLTTTGTMPIHRFMMPLISITLPTTGTG